MFAKLLSLAITGIDAVPVSVEMMFTGGLVSFRIVGLPDKAVQEAADRVKAAVQNSGYDFPGRRLVVNLAPADLRKEGAFFDLPIALGVLAASGQIPEEGLMNWLVAGELSLDGQVRPIRGAVAAAITARQMGLSGVIVPAANIGEAAAVDGIRAVPVETLAEAVGFFTGAWTPPPVQPVVHDDIDHPICYSDIKGQDHVKRAMEVAAAGGHHCLLMGPPGSGKTMAAQRLPTILPPLTPAESLETSKIHSVAGELPVGRGLLSARPFRSPHHNASLSGLIGGGSVPRPGEISLAHNGVLFLDEAPEFPRTLLEALRQPLEDGRIVISRAAGAEVFPARLLLVMSMNLCPCGRRGDTRQVCRCTPAQVDNYVSRLSGPLLDRIDIQVEVPPVEHGQLMEKGDRAAAVRMRERVLAARRIQEERFSGRGSPVNSAMTPKEVAEYCVLDREGTALLGAAMSEFGLSARGHGRVLKVARTVADLAGRDRIASEDIMEAVQYRAVDGR